MALDVVKLEERIDRVAAGGTEISMGLGGVKFATLLELMEFAKLMAVSGAAVPSHLRGNPGTCLAIATKALRFGFDPFSLAEHSYTMVKSTKVDGQWQDVETIAYDSFVIHAIIEAHGNVTGKLKPTYAGEGDERTCTCTGVVNGETLSVTSDTLGKIKARIGRNDKGKLKGSPLWDTKPDQQLWYDTRRDWCRAHQPHVLLGWYDRDELQEHGADRARDVTPEKPSVAARLTGSKGRGFSAKHVENEASRGVVDETPTHQEPNPNPTPASPTPAEPTADDPAPATTNDAPVNDAPEAAAGAGANSESSSAPADAEGERASEHATPSAGPPLPQGWQIGLAGALRRARKVESLRTLAGQYFEKLGVVPSASADKEQAKAIRAAFEQHFGNQDALNETLRELV